MWSSITLNVRHSIICVSILGPDLHKFYKWRTSPPEVACDTRSEFAEADLPL